MTKQYGLTKEEKKTEEAATEETATEAATTEKTAAKEAATEKAASKETATENAAAKTTATTKRTASERATAEAGAANRTGTYNKAGTEAIRAGRTDCPKEIFRSKSERFMVVGLCTSGCFSGSFLFLYGDCFQAVSRNIAYRKLLCIFGLILP